MFKVSNVMPIDPMYTMGSMETTSLRSHSVRRQHANACVLDIVEHACECIARYGAPAFAVQAVEDQYQPAILLVDEALNAPACRLIRIGGCEGRAIDRFAG